MKTPENENQDPNQAYEAPALEIVSLKGDEVLAGSCKDVAGAGPNLTCQDQFGGTCSSIGS